MMLYENEILKVLSEAGEKGMPLRRIALNVYNITNSLFDPKDMEDVYNDVQEYLHSVADKSNQPVERAETRGWYRLNLNSQQVQQLFMAFAPHEDDLWMTEEFQQ